MTQYRKINIWNQTSNLVILMFRKFGMMSMLVIRSEGEKYSQNPQKASAPESCLQ